MRIFGIKIKNYLNVGGFTPEPPFAPSGWWLRLQTPTLLLLFAIASLSSSFLALNAGLLPSKNNKITTVNVLLLLLPRFRTYFSF